MMNALTPEPSLLAKIGSIVIHCDEFMSEESHPFDANALHTLVHDPEVVEWLQHMRTLAMIPEKR